MKNSATILIVDDMEVNRQVLHDVMLSLGHTPVLAENGLSALESLRQHPPDLVLLDILMPKMDGYEVLIHIKDDDALRDIPVIMISAVDELDSIVRCIEQGADDYLIKPFHPPLLKARIAADLEKKRLRDRAKVYQSILENQNVNLEEQVRQKTVELSHAHSRLTLLAQAKSDFLTLVSRELRAPVSGMLGAGELLLKKAWDADTRARLQKVFIDSKERLGTILDEALLLRQIKVLGGNILIEALPADLLLESAIELAADFAESRRVRIEAAHDCGAAQVVGEAGMLTKALAALLKTAVKFSEPGMGVRISTELVENAFTVAIRTTGRTIPEEALPRFFDVLSIAEPLVPGGDIGLAPAVAERIITIFNGSVSVKNQLPSGVLFTVMLRVAIPVSEAGFFQGFTYSEETTRTKS